MHRGKVTAPATTLNLNDIRNRDRLCLCCEHEIDSMWGGPNPNDGVCMGCTDGNMYSAGIYGGI